MDIRQIRYVSAIVQHRSFKKAAEAMNISPSAMSLAVKGLEDELGVRLFDRDTGSVVPTAFGQSLFESGQAIQREFQGALDRLDRIRGSAGGRVNIGLLPYGAVAEMGALLGSFMSRFPRLEVNTSLGTYDLLVESLRVGRLDFVVSEAGATDTDPAIVSEALFSIPYRLVVGRQHPLAERKKLTLKRVLDFPLAYGRDWVSRLAGWEETFSDSELELPRPMFAEGTDVFYRYLIRECDIVGVLPVIGVIRDAIDDKELVELDVAQAKWSSTVSLLHLRNRTLTPAADLMLEQTRLALRHL